MRAPKIALLSANSFTGQVPHDYPNARTEFAWAHYLNADMVPYGKKVEGYDVVLVILPKEQVVRNTDGVKYRNNPIPHQHRIIQQANLLIRELKDTNGKVGMIQEGPYQYFQNYETEDAVAYLKVIKQFDFILAHDNQSALFFRNFNKNVDTIPTVTLHREYINVPFDERQNSAVIGGGFCEWSGGLMGAFVASHAGIDDIIIPESHTSSPDMELVSGVRSVPRMDVNQYTLLLSKSKMGINLMPTIGAGSMALNCIYAGTPYIGNMAIPTSRLWLSIVANQNINHAIAIATEIRTDYRNFAQYIMEARSSYENSNHWPRNFQSHMNEILQ